MLFVKNFTAPNGLVLGYHKIRKIESSFELDTLTITVASWKDEAHYLSEVQAVWNSYVTVSLTEDILSEVTTLLLADPLLTGATSASDNLQSLQAIKDRKWAALKTVRDGKEYSTVEYSSMTFDADRDSQRRVTGAVVSNLIATMAWVQTSLQTLATEAGVTLTSAPNASQDWTLSNNSVTSLDVEELQGLGAAIAAQTASIHGVARTLRASIVASTTPEQVTAIQWPSE